MTEQLDIERKNLEQQLTALRQEKETVTKSFDQQINARHAQLMSVLTQLSKDHAYCMQKLFEDINAAIDEARLHGKHNIERCIAEPRVFDEVQQHFEGLGYKTTTRFVSGYDQDFVYLIIRF